MKFYLISDNVDTSVGMRLCGIEGVVVHEAQEVEEALQKAIADEEVGIVLITTKLMKLCPDIIYEMKLHSNRPLLLDIGDRHGSQQISDAITQYVREAIGIKI